MAAVVGLHDRRAGAVAGLRHPVVHLGHARVLEVPAEQPAPEALRAVGVRRRELHVYDLTGHVVSSLGSTEPSSAAAGMQCPPPADQKNGARPSCTPTTCSR